MIMLTNLFFFVTREHSGSISIAFSPRKCESVLYILARVYMLVYPVITEESAVAS